MQLLLAGLILLLVTIAWSKDIDTFFINKHFPLKTQIPNRSPDIECLVTEGEFQWPAELTFCYRSKPMVYITFARRGWSWRSIVTFGKMQPNSTMWDQGILMQISYGGSWVGLKMPGIQSLQWLFVGKAMARHPFQV